MRILHVISMMASASGGTTQILKLLAAAQAREGHRVTVCTTMIGNHAREQLDVDALRAVSPGVRYEAFPWELRALMFHTLQGLWYRLLVDAKVIEVEHTMRKQGIDLAAAIRVRLGIDLQDRQRRDAKEGRL